MAEYLESTSSNATSRPLGVAGRYWLWDVNAGQYTTLRMEMYCLVLWPALTGGCEIHD